MHFIGILKTIITSNCKGGGENRSLQNALGSTIRTITLIFVKRDIILCFLMTYRHDVRRGLLIQLLKRSAKQALKYYVIFVILLLILDFSVNLIAIEIAKRDVENLIANEDDDFQKIAKIHELVYTSLQSFYNDPTSRRILSLSLIDSTIDIWITQKPSHIFIRKNPVSWSWAYVTKMGNCVEHAAVFATLLKLAGFEARVVRASGEDHVWTEVKMDGKWIRVDASVPPDSPWYGNESYYEEAWKFKISAVITEDGDEVTEKYTDTGTLTVHVTDAGKPVEGIKVCVYSWNPVERRPDKYKVPLFVMEKPTNSTGTAVFMLGGNNYTIKLFRDYFIFRIPVNETNITVKENVNNELNIDISNGCDFSPLDIPLHFGVFLGILHFEWWVILCTCVFCLNCIKLWRKNSFDRTFE